MHLFINALSASAGGGLTYIRNVLPHLQARLDLRVTVALNSGLQKEFGRCTNIDFLPLETPVARRFLYEQTALPRMIRQCGATVLLSVGNFALWRSPVPQILLSRNSLYTSNDFLRDLQSRGDYRAWMETQLKATLAKWSIAVADSAVAPSLAFAEELQQWAGKPVHAIHHGFDRGAFVRDPSPLPGEVSRLLEQGRDSVRLLFVSHYNYYRNFETLIRAVPLIKQGIGKRGVRLFLTCKLAKGENPGAYSPDSAAALVRELGVTEEVVELGAVPYQLLHHLYKSVDIYVTPAYAETFAHPLVEAMSSVLPIVASDLAVHREICGSAAVYFPRFLPQELAKQVLQVAGSPDLARQLSGVGLARSTDFSWSEHVDRIVALARTLTPEER